MYVPLAERLGVHIWKTEFEDPFSTKSYGPDKMKASSSKHVVVSLKAVGEDC